MPTQAIDQSQFARKSEGDTQAPGERVVRNDQPRDAHKAPPKFGDRKFSGGGKQGFGKPGAGGDWMMSDGEKPRAD